MRLDIEDNGYRLKIKLISLGLECHWIVKCLLYCAPSRKEIEMSQRLTGGWFYRMLRFGAATRGSAFICGDATFKNFLEAVSVT